MPKYIVESKIEGIIYHQVKAKNVRQAKKRANECHYSIKLHHTEINQFHDAVGAVLKKDY